MIVGGRRHWSTVAAIGMVVAALCGCGTITSEPAIRSAAESTVPKAAKVATGTPASVELAAIAPGTGDLMGRVRATDACTLLNREFAERLGTFKGLDRNSGRDRGSGWTGCAMTIAASDNPDALYTFNLELDKFYTADKRAADKLDQIGGHQIYRSGSGDDNRPDAYSCEYRIPAGDTGFAHSISLTKLTGSTKVPVPWSQPCRFTRDYLAATLDGISALPPHVIDQSTGKSLLQRNPCAAEPQITALFFGWQRTSIGWPKAYDCAITLVQPGGAHRATVEVSYERSNEKMVKTGEVQRQPSALDGGQSIQYGRHLNMEGLTGIEIRTVQSTDPSRQNTSCAITLNYRRADPPTATNAHLIHISVNIAPPAPPFPVDACARAGQIAPTVLRTLP